MAGSTDQAARNVPHDRRAVTARRRASTDAHHRGSRRPPVRDYVVEDVGGPGAGPRVDGRRVSRPSHAVAGPGFDRRVEVKTARLSGRCEWANPSQGCAYRCEITTVATRSGPAGAMEVADGLHTAAHQFAKSWRLRAPATNITWRRK